jgi:hypothetical protein
VSVLAQPVSAHTIARALGGKHASNGGFICRCPVPGHGRGAGDRNPSLLVSDGDHAPLFKCFGGCDSRDVLDELRRRGLIERRDRDPRSARRPLRAAPVTIDQREQHRKAAAWLWSQRQPIGGTPAERYLREIRGITCALPSTLAYLPPSGEKYPHPTMIAAFGLCDEPEPGELVPPRRVGAVHLTKLRADGLGKAEIEKAKMFLGSPGALPIALAPPNDLLGLAIAEGIEDALSVHQATGLGAWAAGAANFMPKLAGAVPSYIDSVTIYAHDDKAGQAGACELADKLISRGLTVGIEG